MSDDLVKSHIEWLRGDHEACNPFLADRIETLQTRAEKAEAEVLRLREALKVTSAILQAEMYRSGGEPFSGTWTIPPLQIRATCHEALDQANAALKETET